MSGNMTPVEILTRLRQLNVGVRLNGDRLLLDAPKGALTDDLLAELSHQKAAVMSFLRSSEGSGGGRHEVEIERSSHEGLLPLSDGQERLWVLDQLQPGGCDYLMPAAVRVRGKLNLGVLRKSLGEIVRRHESLRTVFPSTDGVPNAVISNPEDPEIAEVDLRDRAPAEREAEALRLVDSNAREPIDLSRGPLWRMKVVRTGDQEYFLLCAVHHIIFDGWSVGVFIRELVEFYTATLEQRPPVVSALPFQYVDFARWQKRRLEGGDKERNLAYWKAKLGGHVQPLELPFDRPPSSEGIPLGALCSLKASKELFERLKGLGKAEGTSLFMVLLAAFDVLLHRLTNQEDILVGAPVAARERMETEGLIGFFVNVVVMLAEFSEERTFRGLLQQVRETALGAYAHQDLPFDKVVTAVDPERDLSRTPLFQVFFNHQNLGIPKIEVAGLTIESLGERVFESKFRLILFAIESAEELTLYLVYNADMFDANRIQVMLEQYEMLLEQICRDPNRSIERYSLVTESAVPLLPDPTIPMEVRWEGSVLERFLTQTAERPDAVAISEPGGEWTYAELERLSGGLAAWLGRQGVGGGDVVTIYGHRSASLVLAILGVLRTGAAFCILDPAYQPSRLCQNFEAARPKGWLQIAEATEPPESLQALVRRNVGNCRLSLPRTYEATCTAEWATGQMPQRETDPDSPAYVTFTSGTTGEPKCVLGTHRPLSHFLAWHCTKFGLQNTDRFSMLSGLAHDPLLRDIFTPLWLGATLCIPETDEILAPGYLAKWMRKEQITVSHLTPAMGALLAESATVELPALRYAFFGGDLLTHRVAALLNRISPDAQIVNFYGATETPQAMAWHSIDSAQLRGCEEKAATAAQPVPIGNAIPDVQMLILNRAGGLVGPGEIGEIFIRTPYLTLGYANDEELTRKRFVVNAFTGRNEDRLYRTGDLGRYRPDGIVEFAGRADQQIKIRGHRVELGEIEAALAAHQSVRQCVVVASEKQTDGQRLVAYVVSARAERPTIQDLRDHLNTLLPDFMIPSAFAFLEAIPLTANGKVNRSALPIPDLSSVPAGYAPPRDEIERIMAKIWAEVLGVQKVGVFEHFFELGGHSLSATRLIARLRSAFQIDLPLKTIFLQPTIDEMSKHILYDAPTRTYRYRSEIPRWNRLVPAQPKGSRNPLFVVAGYMNPDDTLLVLSRIFPHLGLDQPVFGFQPRWLDGHSEKYSCVEEVAREFVTELRAFRPEGPYLLGGDCVGGIVALEMARELLRQGQEVGLLVMLDTERPTPVRALFANLRIAFRRAQHVAAVIEEIIQGKHRSRAQLIRDLVDRKRKTAQPKTLTDEIALDSLYHSRLDYRRMIYRHKVKKYPGQVTLIVNEEDYKIDKKLGWNGVATGGLEIHATPGAHLTRFTLHGREFAKTLLECLERAQAESAPRLRPSHDHVKVGNAISCTDG
jgi:amino acid adenylation domain-containing protein